VISRDRRCFCPVPCPALRAAPLDHLAPRRVHSLFQPPPMRRADQRVGGLRRRRFQSTIGATLPRDVRNSGPLRRHLRRAAGGARGGPRSAPLVDTGLRLRVIEDLCRRLHAVHTTNVSPCTVIIRWPRAEGQGGHGRFVGRLGVGRIGGPSPSPAQPSLPDRRVHSYIVRPCLTPGQESLPLFAGAKIPPGS
jgi:hypothetical protein